jgi:hypothetical protein
MLMSGRLRWLFAIRHNNRSQSIGAHRAADDDGTPYPPGRSGRPSTRLPPSSSRRSSRRGAAAGPRCAALLLAVSARARARARRRGGRMIVLWPLSPHLADLQPRIASGAAQSRRRRRAAGGGARAGGAAAGARCWCSSRASEPELLGFYEQRGFRVRRRLPDYYGRGQHAVRMNRPRPETVGNSAPDLRQAEFADLPSGRPVGSRAASPEEFEPMQRRSAATDRPGHARPLSARRLSPVEVARRACCSRSSG